MIKENHKLGDFNNRNFCWLFWSSESLNSRYQQICFFFGVLFPVHTQTPSCCVLRCLREQKQGKLCWTFLRHSWLPIFMIASSHNFLRRPHLQKLSHWVSHTSLERVKFSSKLWAVIKIGSWNRECHTSKEIPVLSWELWFLKCLWNYFGTS